MESSQTLDILTLAEMQAQLENKRLRVVAKACGVSYPVVLRISKGIAYDYRIGTLRKISDYLRTN